MKNERLFFKNKSNWTVLNTRYNGSFYVVKMLRNRQRQWVLEITKDSKVLFVLPFNDTALKKLHRLLGEFIKNQETMK